MAQRNQRVKVLRAFWKNGETVGKGSVLDLPLDVAIEMRSANKVRFVQSDVKAVQNSEPTQPVTAAPKAPEEPEQPKQAAKK